MSGDNKTGLGWIYQAYCEASDPQLKERIWQSYQEELKLMKEVEERKQNMSAHDIELKELLKKLSETTVNVEKKELEDILFSLANIWDNILNNSDINIEYWCYSHITEDLEIATQLLEKILNLKTGHYEFIDGKLHIKEVIK